MSRLLYRLMRFWPPFWGAGIRVSHVSRNLRKIKVELHQRPWNKNYVGTAYGGSLYSMTDPFYMLILLQSLGSDYIVWDKAASIRFKKPGRGKLRATFEITDDELESIRKKAHESDKVEPRFEVQIFDQNGDVVAEVEKLLYIKMKSRAKN